MASINGFSVVKFGDSALAKFAVPGTSVRLSLRKEIAPLMLALARDFHRNVESIKKGECWGHDFRKISGTDTWSHHAAGIAIDLNAPEHPRFKHGTFSSAEVRAIRDLLSNHSYQGVKLFRWGGDFSTNVDEMHFEINVPRGIALAAAQTIGTNHGNPPMAAADHAPGTRQLQVADPRLNGADVTYVQKWIGESRCGPADGFFGPGTSDGVRWYQGMRGIAVTGLVDRPTWRNMRIEATF